ncbi:MAG: lipid kinase, partial [Desulfobacteraceae bacterium]
MQTKRGLIIVNTLARKGVVDVEEVQNILRHGGIETAVFIFENVPQIRRAIRRHTRQVDMIIVGGGDGTLNAAVEPVLAAGLPLGVLPLGTGNDLARTLQIPAEPHLAAQVIAAGHIKKIDLGWVNHKHFFNVASIGLAVKVTDALTPPMKKRWGALAYPMTLLSAYRSTRPFRAHITCDGTTHRLKSIQIAIGNGRHYGGGMSIRHDAAIDDHRLNLYSLKPHPVHKLIRAVPAIIKGVMEQ